MKLIESPKMQLSGPRSGDAVDNHPPSSRSLRRQLLRAAGGSGLLKILNVFLTLGVLVVLGRELGPSDFGAYTFALSFVTIIAIPTQVGLPTLLVREVATYQQRKQWGLLKGVIVRANQVCVMALLALVPLVAIIVLWYPRASEGAFSRPTLLWALALVPLISLGNVRGAILQGFRRIVVGQIPELLLRPGLLLVLVIILYPRGGLSSDAAMMLHACAAAAAFLFGSVVLIRVLPREVKASHCEYDTLRWGRSLGPMSLLAGAQVINGQTDIIMLGLLAEAHEVGLYRVAAQIAAVIILPVTAVAAVIAPYVARMLVEDDRSRLQRLLTMATRLSAFVVLLMAGATVVLADLIIGAVMGTEYLDAALAMRILVSGNVAFAVFGSVLTVAIMGRLERTALGAAAAGAALNIIMNMAFIPVWGMNGAAAATILSMIVWKAALAFNVKKHLHVRCYPW